MSFPGASQDGLGLPVFPSLCAGGRDPASSLVLQGQTRALSLGALLSSTDGFAELEGGLLLL